MDGWTDGGSPKNCPWYYVIRDRIGLGWGIRTKETHVHHSFWGAGNACHVTGVILFGWRGVVFGRYVWLWCVIYGLAILGWRWRWMWIFIPSLFVLCVWDSMGWGRDCAVMMILVGFGVWRLL
jgi:hypothetical protein